MICLLLLLALSIGESETLDKIAQDKPVKASEWHDTVRTIDKQIKDKKGVKVKEYNNKLKHVVNYMES